MISLIQLIIALVICIVVPLLIGDLLLPNEAMGKQYIMGLLGTMAVSQMLFLPFIIFQHHYTPYFIIYIIIIGGCSIYSVVKRHKHYLDTCKLFFRIKDNIGEVNVWMVFAISLILVQVLRVAIGHFFVYADNVFYIPVTNDILETDLDYYLDFNLGAPGNKESNIKYVFTTYFPYLASVCKISGLHPAIFVQTVLPIILTPTLYILVWHYGKVLFDDKRTTWMFVFFFAVLVETIGGYDFTFANHAVSGIYFGKKVVFTILLPYIVLFIVEKTSLLEDTVTNLSGKNNLLLLLMVIGVCAPSLMGTGLAPIALFSLGIVLAIRKKTVVPLIQMGIAMMPSIIFLLMAISYLYF